MAGTEFKVGDIVIFKSKENMKGVSMWNESMREDLPREFKITGIVNGFDWKEISGHNTQYNISDKMLTLLIGVSDNKLVEFKAGDRVRFKSLSECKKLTNWNSEMNYLAGKEFTIAGTIDTSSYSATQIIIPVKVFEGTVWSINNRMIEHIPKESTMDKIIKSFASASTVEPREGYKGYPEYSSHTMPVPKFDVPDFMRTATGATYADKYGMPNPYGTSVCDVIEDASRYLSKADYEISQEYFDKKHSKKEYKKRITFSKVQ